MYVQENLRPTYSDKAVSAMKAECAVKRITFSKTEANPGDTLNVTVPKLSENDVVVPGSLALLFNIDLPRATQTTFSFRTSRGPLLIRWL